MLTTHLIPHTSPTLPTHLSLFLLPVPALTPPPPFPLCSLSLYSLHLPTSPRSTLSALAPCPRNAWRCAPSAPSHPPPPPLLPAPAPVLEMPGAARRQRGADRRARLRTPGDAPPPTPTPTRPTRPTPPHTPYHTTLLPSLHTLSLFLPPPSHPSLSFPLSLSHFLFPSLSHFLFPLSLLFLPLLL